MKILPLFPVILVSVLPLILAEQTLAKDLRPPTIGKPQPAFPIQIIFSAAPQDSELQLATMFPDRLVPMGTTEVENENADLGATLKLFAARTSYEDFTMLETFLQQHPSSRWNASLLLNLGLMCYDTGHLSQALQYWEGAWNLSKNETDLTRRAIADRAIGEALLLNARLGRVSMMEHYLAELGERPVEGSVAANVDAAKEGMLRMKVDPGVAFKCGPFALNSILNFRDKTPHRRTAELEAARSTPQGTNLVMVRDWAASVGLDYQIAKREPSGQFIYPAVMHWKLDHFAALLEQRDNRFLVQDATFGGTEMWITAAALDAETDGYFLVPNEPLPPGWRTVSDEEAQHVWGKGGASTREEDTKTCPKGNPACKQAGMPVANYYLMQATSNIQDIPLYYQPPVGPAITFLANYNHNETGTPEINTHSHLGANWDFNWVGYLEVDPSYSVSVRLRDGGTERYHFSLFNNVTSAYAPNVYSQAVLKWTTDEAGRDSYRREMADGSAEIYSQPGQPGTTGRFYLKNIVDPQGNKVTINYEVYPGNLSTITYSEPPVPGQHTDPNISNPKWSGRINEIVDAAGGVTFIRYLSNKTSATGFRKIKQIIDPYGRIVEFTYDGTVSQPGKINSIKDVVGMVSTFSYAADGFIEVMNTPYGKTLFHRYNKAGTFEMVDFNDPKNPVELTLIDMMRGLKVTYPNGSSSVVESWLGHAQSSFHWNQTLMNKYPNEPLLGDPTKYSNCEIYEWRLSSGSNEMSSVLRSVKKPLLGIVYFDYEGSSSQTVTIGEEGSAEEVTHHYAGGSNLPTESISNDQTFSAAYNILGNLTSFTDPVNRVTKHYYDGNGVDLLEIRQVNGSNEDLLAKIIYEKNHLPKKIFDAAGQANEFTYNEYGQVLTVKDPLGHITTYTYVKPVGSTNSDAHDSLLQTIDGPLPGNEDVITFTYDNGQRIESMTDSEGYRTSYEYDDLNRIIRTTHQPQGVSLANAEYEEVVWDRLDPVLIRDRKGRLTHRKYNEMGWLVSETDSEGRTIELDWCTCGSLAKLIDGNGNITRWEYDELGRQVKKIRANGRVEEYTYMLNENRLQYVTTADDTRKAFIYNDDDSISQIKYYIRERDVSGNPVSENGLPKFVLDVKTPPVWLDYDPVHPRLKTIKKSSTEASISYEYFPFRTGPQAAPLLGAGSISRVNEHDLNAAIIYTYDELGRVQERSIWSVVDDELVDDNHRVAMEYDAMGRMTEMTDVLGTFGFEYDQSSKGLSRLSKVNYPNGQETTYTYLAATQHHRLEKITHRTSANELISEYGYGFGFGGDLRRWSQKVGAAPQQDWTLEHDDSDQLRSVVVTEGSSIVRQQYYNYDAGGNRVSYQDGNSVMKFGHNNMNQMNARPAGGLVRFEGTVNEPGTVSVNSQTAKMRTVSDESEEPQFRFSLDLSLDEGSNVVTVAGLDGSGNATSQDYEVEVSGLTGQTEPSYDLRGNMLNNGRGQDYEWDALNQLVAINYGDSSRSEFTYDALNRRVKEVEIDEAGDVIGEKLLLWEGAEIVQERTPEGVVVRRYASLGTALSNNLNYYFTHDHLGSVRQVMDEAEEVVESYAYDAYGVQTVSAAGGPGGSRLADFRFTGHWYHEKSDLHLAPYRAYDARAGVWISEDPIEEDGGVNLYEYVSNSPIVLVDPLGLQGGPRGGGMAGGGGGGGGGFGGRGPIRPIAPRVVPPSVAPYTPGTCPVSPKIGINRTIKHLHDSGFVYKGPTKSGGGRMYEHPSGDQIRIMPKPTARPRSAPAAKYESDQYCRFKPKNGAWQPHKSIPNSDIPSLIFPPSSGGCFVAGTLVWTPEGMLPIETIGTNSYVFCYDERSGQIVTRKVTKTFTTSRSDLFKFKVGDNVFISCSSNHRFYQGDSKWIAALQLKPQNVLWNAKGVDKALSRVDATVSKDTRDGLVQVYNFEVDEFHNYFISSEKILVHNGKSVF
ncbi:intein/RHS repeat-associated protein [Prosthecobacter fusiformis]|uniref:Intein/RHS repeat-associated protein n=1 Tax=Prosthecobacter fusiformis TaxID=48464 RepID=A0A4R7SQ75_9BACT|nr:RHS repeat-associated core domain-containing protein [Prosthecobacter fusiformis]TDU80785.1 intein/RHS repeat-associated protein [Prosthecobacter fusiformis]